MFQKTNFLIKKKYVSSVSVPNKHVSKKQVFETETDKQKETLPKGLVFWFLIT